MIRAALLAACATAALFASPARAQFVCANCGQEVTQVLQWGQQAANMARSISGDVQRLQQLQATYYALTRVTDLGSAVSALNMLGIRNPLPINPYAMQSLLSGQGSPTGMMSNLGNLFTGTTRTNTVYAVQQDTWLTRQIAANGAGISGAQAVALQLYQSAADRVTGLQELQARIDGAADPAERGSLIARFGAEQAFIQNQQVQATNLGNYMAAQFALREQQREERLHQSIDEVLADARGRGWMP